MRKFNKVTLTVFISILSILLLDIVCCTLLYFFEPISYNEPDLSKLNYTFELYEKFSYDKNNEFYIKQITADNIVAHDKDKRLKYVDDTVLIFTEDDVSYSEVSTYISSINGLVCGYIANVNMYQIEFPNTDYDELINICSQMQNSDLIEVAMIDYFEETPSSTYSKELTSEEFEYYTQTNETYMNAINYHGVSDYNYETIDNIRVGIFDDLIDDNGYFDIINLDTYDDGWKTNPQTQSYNFHGTHVAGILAAKESSYAPAICPGADIVSEHALNNSISYWVAAISDMVMNYDVKVINMSMGYNSFITIGASLGSEKEISFVEKEAEFFEALLKNLKNNDKEFIICIAAGNSQDESVNLVNSPVFKYGNKPILDAMDIFNIFTRTPEFCNAKYTLPFSCIDDEEISDMVIVVGSFNTMGEYSYFSNRGERVDILAPGESIYSFVLDGEYGFSSGTSMSCPFVSGTAALMFALNPEITPKEVKNIIINSGTNQPIYANDIEYPVLNVDDSVLASLKKN